MFELKTRRLTVLAEDRGERIYIKFSDGKEFSISKALYQALFVRVEPARDQEAADLRELTLRAQTLIERDPDISLGDLRGQLGCSPSQVVKILSSLYPSLKDNNV